MEKSALIYNVNIISGYRYHTNMHIPLILLQVTSTSSSYYPLLPLLFLILSCRFVAVHICNDAGHSRIQCPGLQVSKKEVLLPKMDAYYNTLLVLFNNVQQSAVQVKISRATCNVFKILFYFIYEQYS